MDTGMDPQPQAQALIPFTGYYALDIDAGAFLMIDTHFTWAADPTSAPVQEYFATVSVSPDGQSCNEFEVGAECSFDGRTLTIETPGAMEASLTLVAENNVSMLAGTLNGESVSATGSFGPTPLSLWSGTYYAQGVESGPGVLHYEYVPTLQINGDGTVFFAQADGKLEAASSYWYDFGMFVIGVPLANGGSQLFEMGVTSGWGRVAGNADTGGMLVSLQLNQQAPHL